MAIRCSNSAESRFIHPLAEQWLQARGYTYTHEPYLGGKYPDFVAYLPDNTVLILECKHSIWNEESAAQALGQIQNYRKVCVPHLAQVPRFVRLALFAEFSAAGRAVVLHSGVEAIHVPANLLRRVIVQNW